MSTIKAVWHRVPAGWGQVDVLASLVVILVADVTVLTVDVVPLRTLAGVPLLLFLPGYGLLMVLFPGGYDRGERTADGDERARFGRRLRSRGPTVGERMALSFGASVALLPLIVVALAALGRPLDAVSVVGAVSLVAAVGVVLGAFRRRRLPAHERFRLSLRGWRDALGVSATGATSRVDRVLTAGLALAVLVAAAGLVYAGTTATTAESSTTMTVLDENESGTLVAGDYPSNVTLADDEDLLVRVENHERERTAYELVVELQQVRASNGSIQVRDRRAVGRTGETLAPGETWNYTHQVTSRSSGTNRRLTYLLYRNETPDRPTTESAYRHVVVWLETNGTAAQ